MTRIPLGLCLIGVGCAGTDPVDDATKDPTSSDTDTDTDADSDTDTDSDTDADTDTDTDTDSGTGDTDSGTGDTGGGGGSDIYADCVAVYTTSLSPAVTTFFYDPDGFIDSVATDLDGDTVVDTATTYVWQLDGAGSPLRSDWSDTMGNVGFVEYDPQGWPIAIFSDYGVSTATTSQVNTYDLADLIVSHVSTTVETGTVSMATYDACEHIEVLVSDLDGMGTFVTTTTAVWTYGAGCVPQSSVQTADFFPDVITSSFDVDGRITGTVSVGGYAQWTSTYAWTCP